MAPGFAAGDQGVLDPVYRLREVCSGWTWGTLGTEYTERSEKDIMVESNQVTPEGIDETVSMLDGGIKNLAMNAALNQIEGWRLRLEASGVPELQPIADGLGRLQNHLTSDEVDARAVGGILADLGVASTDISRPVSGRLEALAGILSDEGRRLSGSS